MPINICIFYHSEMSGATKSILTLENSRSTHFFFIKLPWNFMVSLGIIKKNFKRISRAKIILLNDIDILRIPSIILLSYFFNIVKKKVFIYWHSCEWIWQLSSRIKYGIKNNILKFLIYDTKFFEKRVNYLAKKHVNITVSNFCAEWIKNKFNVNSKIEILNESVDTKKIISLSRFQAADVNVNKFKVIMALGAIQLRKGFHLFLEVANKAPNSYKFIWVGKKGNLSDYYSRRIRSINEESGYEKILILDYRSNPYSLLKKCDIYFLPSLQEPFSLSYLEALTLGKFIICPLKKNGFAEVLIGKTNIGFIYQNISEVIDLLKSKEIDSYIFNYIEQRVEFSKNFDKRNFRNKLLNIIHRNIK